MRLPAARLPTTKRASAARHDDTVERAFELAASDPARLDDLLGALRLGWLWVPLPDDDEPVTDGSAVHLPTVRYLGDVFIPAYTSAPRLEGTAPDPPAGSQPPVIPHVVVRAADLARRLPPGLGIALNPGSPRSIPVSPAGVSEIAAEHATVGGRRVTVGPPPAAAPALLGAVAASLRAISPVREAATAWLTVAAPPAGDRRAAGSPAAGSAAAGSPAAGSPAAGSAGPGPAGAGLIISVRLDDPADAPVRDAVIAAVQGALAAEPGEAEWPVDVTFPGEGEPDVIDRWVAAGSAPFYQRDARVELPAPRRPAS
jgi:SseB protein N-terminal domain